MDFLEEERNRGITIKAAAITLPWKGYQINLIDTPGHVDFTLEVERAMRCMDGAVTVIDGVHGVEAQTATVWQQADKNMVSRVVFVNKCDKPGADFRKCLKEIESRLKCNLLMINYPIYKNDVLVGVNDVVNEKFIKFSGQNGEEVEYSKVDLAQERNVLLEKIAELDERFLEEYLENQNQPPDNVNIAIARITEKGLAVPILSGASFKNIGIQCLLDAVTNYLPKPKVPNATKSKALAFKIQNDEQRGIMVFVRVYSGTLRSNQLLYNISKGKKERIQRIMLAFGKELHEVDCLTPGNIGVLLGLRVTETGDTLADHVDASALPRLPIPSPVFQVACLADGKSDEDKMTELAAMMCREDPSLQFVRDLQTGQFILSGMGELHLEVSGKHLAKAVPSFRMGEVRIAYMETLAESIKGELQYDKRINDLALTGLLSIEVDPLPLIDGTFVPNALQVDIPSDALRLPKHVDSREYCDSVRDGLTMGLLNGPIRCAKMTGLRVTVRKLHYCDTNSTLSALRHCAIQLVQNLYRLFPNRFRLVEPFMSIQIKCPSEDLGTILSDLHSSRRATVFSYESDTFGMHLVLAEAPLSELIGYVTWLRTVTSGRASMQMCLKGYRE